MVPDILTDLRGARTAGTLCRVTVVGQTISHYRVIRQIGAGGMGVVYLAEDTRLNRRVALKFLPPSLARDAHAKTRFMREAQAASALDHVNVATIYEIADWEAQLFIAMAFYEGETLKQRLDRGPLPIPEAERILRELATGLAAAHDAGIVHRDLKPANVMLTSGGQVKILDFGLAKITSDTRDTATQLTQAGTTVGTVAYMSPEQVRGADVDARTDIWALGVIGFEMLTGRVPFKCDNIATALLSLVNDEPLPVRTLRPDTPAALAQLIEAAMVKSQDQRTLTAAQVAASLPASGSTGAAIVERPAGWSIGRHWIVLAALLCVVALAGAGWFARRTLRTKWAREQGLPQIERLIEQERFVEASLLARDVRRDLPTDPVWSRLEPLYSRSVSVDSTPPGALVSYREYKDANGSWTALGESPLKDVRVPFGFFAWKAEKAGYGTAFDISGTGAGPPVGQLRFILQPTEKTTEGMLFVPPDPRYQLRIPGLDHLPPVALREFWIDKYEVTNREYKRFVDGGGYRQPEYWREPFVDGSRRLTFDEAMRVFTDTSGRPGPATWELGRYADGQDDVPVTGISWYEASAYAAFAGKSLPTIYHWSRVAEQRTSQFVVPPSNFAARGPIRVGSTGALNRFGAFDMAGNVKEWCWNRADASKRYILGGAWDEPTYQFNDPDARSPMERKGNFGFRCVKYSGEEELLSKSGELVTFGGRDYASEKPVSDQVFEVYRRMYAYDKISLDARIEAVDDTHPDWRRERVSFAAAYGNERVPAWVYLPKGVRPPYQAVVYFPGSNVLQLRSGTPGLRNFDWIVKSGRALIFPIYKSTYERGDGVQNDYPSRTTAHRDHVIAWAKDVSRAVDYLQSRPDIARERIAYAGFSWGAAMAPVNLAVEDRFKAAILIVGGFYLQDSLPEADPFNFAPRVTTPVLLLNGRFDFFYPMDTSQVPMFSLLGVPESQKRRIIYDTGHNIPRTELVREGVDWLDRYLGPVK
jgi:serine/threonine protein kinase/dienelactone hydrolase